MESEKSGGRYQERGMKDGKDMDENQIRQQYGHGNSA
jgi:hypothetical protein